MAERLAGGVGGIGGAAFLDGHDHFLCDLGKDGGALGVLRTFGLLNVMPFGMSGHEFSSLLGIYKISSDILAQVPAENQPIPKNFMQSV